MKKKEEKKDVPTYKVATHICLTNPNTFQQKNAKWAKPSVAQQCPTSINNRWSRTLRRLSFPGLAPMPPRKYTTLPYTLPSTCHTACLIVCHMEWMACHRQRPLSTLPLCISACSDSYHSIHTRKGQLERNRTDTTLQTGRTTDTFLTGYKIAMVNTMDTPCRMVPRIILIAWEAPMRIFLKRSACGYITILRLCSLKIKWWRQCKYILMKPVPMCCVPVYLLCSRPVGKGLLNSQQQLPLPFTLLQLRLVSCNNHHCLLFCYS